MERFYRPAVMQLLQPLEPEGGERFVKPTNSPAEDSVAQSRADVFS
jgi:hypothetical protein